MQQQQTQRIALNDSESIESSRTAKTESRTQRQTSRAHKTKVISKHLRVDRPSPKILRKRAGLNSGNPPAENQSSDVSRTMIFNTMSYQEEALALDSRES
jgi:hypothetical protein